jgi:hypothetical protein
LTSFAGFIAVSSPVRSDPEPSTVGAGLKPAPTTALA